MFTSWKIGENAGVGNMSHVMCWTSWENENG